MKHKKKIIGLAVFIFIGLAIGAFVAFNLLMGGNVDGGQVCGLIVFVMPLAAITGVLHFFIDDSLRAKQKMNKEYPEEDE